MDAPPSRPRRRWLRRLLILTALLALLVAFAPRIAAPFVRTRLVDALAERTGAEVVLERLSLAWPGRATLAGLVVRAPDGPEHGRVERAVARVDLWAALGGDVRATVEVEGWSARARRRADGSWSLEDLAGKDRPAGSAGEAAGEGSGSSVRARAELRGGRVLLEDAGRTADLALARTRLGLDEGVLAIEHFEVASDVLSGRLGGRLEGLEDGALALRELEGEFTYVPDALAPWVGPYLPGELSGAGPERVELRFDGPLDRLTLEDVLATGSGRSHFGLGRFAAFGIEATGGLGLEIVQGQLRLGGDLSANGGSLTLAAGLGGGGADLSLRLDGARASAQLASLIGQVHPVFSGLDQLEGAELEGLLVARLDLAVDGPVSLAQLTEGFDLARVHGSGSLALDQAVLRGSPFLAELLTALGEPVETRLDLAPMSFRFDGGRLTYAEKWRWAIDGVDTWFGGSVGVAGDLDLAWELPITAALVRRHRALEALQGTSLRVPLRGTLGEPELDWDAALEGLAEQALRARARRELGVPDLKELLEGGDAQAILGEADRLWNEGKPDEAAPLYQALRDRHRLSPVYLLNKSRIDARRR